MTLSVMGLYHYDNSLFNTMALPEAVDRSSLIAMILMHSGAVLGYLPYLLLIGTACGCATAAVTAGVLRIVRPS